MAIYITSSYNKSTSSLYNLLSFYEFNYSNFTSSDDQTEGSFSFSKALSDSSCDSFLNIPLGKIMLSHTKAFYDMHSRATI